MVNISNLLFPDRPNGEPQISPFQRLPCETMLILLLQKALAFVVTSVDQPIVGSAFTELTICNTKQYQNVLRFDGNKPIGTEKQLKNDCLALPSTIIGFTLGICDEPQGDPFVYDNISYGKRMIESYYVPCQIITGFSSKVCSSSYHLKHSY